MDPTAALLPLAARAGVTDLDVRLQPPDTVLSWRYQGLRFASRLRPGQPTLHVTEAPGALRSPFAFAASGAFVGNDPELVAWLQQGVAAQRLAAFVGMPVPWVAQARPRGQSSCLACLEVTGDPFAAALAILGAVAAALLPGAAWPEQPFGYPSDADALYDATSAPPPDFRAQSSGATDAALRDMARVQDAVQAAMPRAPAGSEQQRFNEAYRLIPNRRFEEAVTTFQSLAAEFPHRAGDCWGQSGAALYFLGRYQDAIAHYRRALELGADPGMMRDNIEEAEEALRKKR